MRFDVEYIFDKGYPIACFCTYRQGQLHNCISVQFTILSTHSTIQQHCKVLLSIICWWESPKLKSWGTWLIVSGSSWQAMHGLLPKQQQSLNPKLVGVVVCWPKHCINFSYNIFMFLFMFFLISTGLYLKSSHLCACYSVLMFSSTALCM